MTEQILEKQIDHNDGIDLEAAFQESHIQEILDKLDQELVGLKSVKNKIREMAALLLVDRIRKTHIPHPKMLQREITEMKIKGSIKTNR
jgi:hypothetical protein